MTPARHLRVVAAEETPTPRTLPPAPRGRDRLPRWYDPTIPLTVWVCAAIMCACVFGVLVTLRSW